MIKVLFVTRGFPSETDIMRGNYEAVQAKALVAKGCEVAVITNRERSGRHFLDMGKISHRVVDGVDVYEGISISIHKRIVRRINKYTRLWSFKKLFERYVEETGMPDIVHAHIILYAASIPFVKNKFQIPFIITEHWTKTNVTQIPKWLRNISFAYHQADQVICVSPALADSLKRNFHVKSIVINNMVSDLFFKTSKIKRNDNLFKFIAVGAFRRNKGFDILIDAFAQGHFPKNVKLDIVGDGEEFQLVHNRIQQYGISDQVKLLGTKTPEEVNDLLCNSDCFVLSSRLETFAIVVIEAMAKGLPVIATRSGGPETFLLQEHGILVEKENVDELTEAMEYMTEHDKDYDSDGIRQYCYNHFSQDVIANQIIDVYNKVLNRETN